MSRHSEQLLMVIAAIIIAGVMALSWGTNPVGALDYGPQQVIAAVNDIRTQYDLPPYDVSQALMDIAQQQANYMAEIQRLTHDRADGSGVPTTAENVAFGPVNRAIASWIDDQLHFDTLTGWSSGQVGVGIAQGEDGLVYISLNMNRYGDSEYKPIPYTLQPGVTPQPVPTQAPVVVVESSAETIDMAEADALSAEESEAVAYVLPEEETQENYPVVSDKPVLLIMPEEDNLVIETKGNRETTAYILLAIGAVGVMASFIGLIYALRLMKANRKAITQVDEDADAAQKFQRDAYDPGDTSSSQEIPQEAQEE